MSEEKMDLRARLAAKKAQIAAREAVDHSARFAALTADKERRIALDSRGAGDITAGILQGQFTAVDVVTAMVRRCVGLAESAGCNAVADAMYGEAWAAAEAIDRDVGRGVYASSANGRGSSSRPGPSLTMAIAKPSRASKQAAAGAGGADGGGLPPLLGVPVSIKDHVDVKGFDSTIGLAARCLRPKAEDAVCVQLLREAGAIPFVKSTNPQSCMVFECESNVFGTTISPWDATRTPGGSSGGEGALLAARASLLGIGTDIGGSIRYPANAAGVYGFKPTPMRVSVRGLALPFVGDRNGQHTIQVTLGPLATTVEDCARVCRAWWATPKMWERDPTVAPLLWDERTYRHGPRPNNSNNNNNSSNNNNNNEPTATPNSSGSSPSKLLRGKEKDKGEEEAAGRKLRVGVLRHDNFFLPCATGRRAVQEAAEAFERAGHEVVEVAAPEGKDGWEVQRLFFHLLAADGSMDGILRGLEGEARSSLSDGWYMLSTMSNATRTIAEWYCWLRGEERLRTLLGAFKKEGLSTREYWDAVADLEDLKRAWFHGTMDAHGVDVLLLPGVGLPAFLHGYSSKAGFCNSYLHLANLLHTPCGAVPVTTVGEGETDYPLAELPADQRDECARAAAEVLRGAKGMPMGVQVMARPYADELVLHAMAVLEREVGFNEPAPVARGTVTKAAPDDGAATATASSY